MYYYTTISIVPVINEYKSFGYVILYLYVYKLAHHGLPQNYATVLKFVIQNKKFRLLKESHKGRPTAGSLISGIEIFIHI